MKIKIIFFLLLILQASNIHSQDSFGKHKSLTLGIAGIKNGKDTISLCNNCDVRYDWLYYLYETDCQWCNEYSVNALKFLVNKCKNDNILIIANYAKVVDFKILCSYFSNFEHLSFFNRLEPLIFYNSLPIKSSLLLPINNHKIQHDYYFLINGPDTNNLSTFINKHRMSVTVPF